MPPSRKTSMEELDERLALLRDRVLAENETVVAQVEADHGQAVVVTSHRILILKVGIAATGKLDGEVVGQFPFPVITSVSVRKGPLGAVIQVCTAAKATPIQGAVPDNVVVFTGPQRVTKCESIATKIESAIGKPLEWIQASDKRADEETIRDTDKATVVPKTERNKLDEQSLTSGEETTAAEPELLNQEATETALANSDVSSEEPISHKTSYESASEEGSARRKRRSLAEEVYSDMLASSVSRPSESAEQIANREPVDKVGRDEQDQSAQSSDAVPADIENKNESLPHAEPATRAPSALRNPRLPKPVQRRVKRDKAVMLIVVLLAVLLAGIAAVAPSRFATVDPPHSKGSTTRREDSGLLYKHLLAVTNYRNDVRVQVARAIEFLDIFESAIKSGDKSALMSLAAQSRLEEVCTIVERLDTPAGLLGAKEQILAGLSLARTLVGKISIDLQTVSGEELRRNLVELYEAKSKLKRGLDYIDTVRAQIERRCLDARKVSSTDNFVTTKKTTKSLPLRIKQLK